MTEPFRATWTRRLDPNGRVAYKVYASLHTDTRVVREDAWTTRTHTDGSVFTASPSVHAAYEADEDAARSIHDEQVDYAREQWDERRAADESEVD